MSNRAISVLVHGFSKVGKSTLGITGPAPRLLLDVESASRFLPGNKVYWEPDTGEAPPEPDGTWDTCVVNVRSFDTVLKAYEWLKSGRHPFRSVTLDSVSELQTKAQESINGRQQMQTQHWGQLLSKMGFFCRDLRDLTTHRDNPLEAVIITAMTKEVNGVQTPGLQGSVAAQIPYWYDLCGYYYLDQTTDESGQTVKIRRLLTEKHPQFEAGSRISGIPPVIDNPNIAMMLDKIFPTQQ